MGWDLQRAGLGFLIGKNQHSVQFLFSFTQFRCPFNIFGGSIIVMCTANGKFRCPFNFFGGSIIIVISAANGKFRCPFNFFGGSIIIVICTATGKFRFPLNVRCYTPGGTKHMHILNL